MPTLECLDERSRAILAKLEDMDERYKATHEEFREGMREANRALSARMTKIEDEIRTIKNEKAYEDGKRSGLALAGAVAISAFSAICGAVGNVIWQWATSPRGPIGPLH